MAWNTPLIGRSVSKNFKQTARWVGADKKNSVVMGEIDGDCVRDAVKNVVVGEPMAASTA